MRLGRIAPGMAKECPGGDLAYQCAGEPYGICNLLSRVPLPRQQLSLAPHLRASPLRSHVHLRLEIFDEIIHAPDLVSKLQGGTRDQ